MKYIDAEKLIAEIKRYKNKADERLKIKGRTFSEEQKDLALQNLCGNLLYFISSHQQEMKLPDKYQTLDWIWEDKTIDQLAEEYVEGVKKCNDAPTWDLIHTAVCYGYELGKTARGEE